MTDAGLDAGLLAKVRQLREQGSSPKQIARALGLRPAEVAPLVRQVAEMTQTHADPADRVLLGCWVSPGWSDGLGLDGTPAEWATLDPLHGKSTATGGLAKLLIVRQERASRVAVCGFMVDMYCLGVKDALGPELMGAGASNEFARRYFSAFDDPPVAVPLELAQALVYGAEAYARSLGFEPHSDFAAAAPYLGPAQGPSPIVFGRDGEPYYISGPYDQPRRVLDTLEASVGPGNYHFIVPA